jgi:hypothetical protein
VSVGGRDAVGHLPQCRDDPRSRAALASAATYDADARARVELVEIFARRVLLEQPAIVLPASA